MALVACVGCGQDDGYRRVAVSGKITVDGNPLETGTISLVPIQAGPAVQAKIAAGEYAIARSEGPAAGAYRVEVYSVQSTGRKVADGDNPGELIDEARNIIPERYNLRSELRAEVKPDGDQQFNFAVDTKADAKADTGGTRKKVRR
ncbi:hypothetical protein [Aquisphaera insulae]|uniref:hypothetical protein n=1 Tax=Aquisphaera insulae TaxID=2712864 RepID=UPI0013ED5BE6|nr:hypothetical protein [Aquisphaera insulae]